MRHRSPDAREPRAGDRRPPAAVGPAAAPGAPPREISLPGLATTLRRGIWLLLAVVLLVLLATAVGLKLSAPLYQATLVVGPAERDLGAASRLAADLEQYADFATLAQTPARFDQISPLERYVEMLASVALAERLEAGHGLLRQIFADQWDPVRERWRPPPGLSQRIRRAVLTFFGFPGWTPPDAAALAQYLRDSITVVRPPGAAVRRLEMQHRDGAFAADLLTRVHEAADTLLREQARERVRRQIDEVERARAEAVRSERRDALEALLADQYRAEALLGAEVPFAAEILRPAAAGAAPVSPGPFLVLGLGLVVGVILGVFVVFLRDALRGHAR